MNGKNLTDRETAEIEIFNKLQGLECELYYAAQTFDDSEMLEAAARDIKALLPELYQLIGRTN